MKHKLPTSLNILKNYRLVIKSSVLCIRIVMGAGIYLHIFVIAILIIVARSTVENYGSKILEFSEESARFLIFGPKPESRESIATEFRLYTPERTDEPLIIKNTEIDSWNPAESGFNAAYKTKFITHGFIHATATWPKDMKDALLKRENLNVFIVNWDGGDGPVYEQAVANTRVVGQDIGLLIQHLVKTVQLKLEDVHLIGHSLGAHVSGFGGKSAQALLKQKVGRITGLDPAGPAFYLAFASDRLDATDAVFVDAIHTDWALSRFSGFGMYKAVAHFDFYPNGGEHQPGCPTPIEALGDALGNAGSILKNIFDEQKTQAQVNETVEKIFCSHTRAFDLYITSIEGNCNFESLRCDDWSDFQDGKCGTCADHKCIQMGYNVDKYKNLYPGEAYRKFFLTTTGTYPYCTK